MENTVTISGYHSRNEIKLNVNNEGVEDWVECLGKNGFYLEFSLFNSDEFGIDIQVYKNKECNQWIIELWDESCLSSIFCEYESEKIECLRIFIEMAKNITIIRREVMKLQIS